MKILFKINKFLYLGIISGLIICLNGCLGCPPRHLPTESLHTIPAKYSQLITKTIFASDSPKPQRSFQFVTVATEHRLLLKHSPYTRTAYSQLIEPVQAGMGENKHGYRSYFL